MKERKKEREREPISAEQGKKGRTKTHTQPFPVVVIGRRNHKQDVSPY